MQASQILSIPIDRPDRLFSSAESIKKEFQSLIKYWHPDKNEVGCAPEVGAHLIQLYSNAKKQIKSDNWKGAHTIRFKTSTGKSFRFKYKEKIPFELGYTYEGKTTLMYVIKEEFAGVVRQGMDTFNNIEYSSPKLKTQFKPLIPRFLLVDTDDNDLGGIVLVIKKPDNAKKLSSIIKIVDLDPKHVGWIIGGMYNITTFLSHVGITHNGISINNVYLDTETHAVYLLGGWWYATPISKEIKGLSPHVASILPKKVFVDKIASPLYDIKATKGLLLRLLGDQRMIGSSLLSNSKIPNEMVRWGQKPATLSSLVELTGWYDILTKLFGPKKFIKFIDDISSIA